VGINKSQRQEAPKPMPIETKAEEVFHEPSPQNVENERVIVEQTYEEVKEPTNVVNFDDIPIVTKNMNYDGLIQNEDKSSIDVPEQAEQPFTKSIHNKRKKKQPFLKRKTERPSTSAKEPAHPKKYTYYKDNFEGIKSTQAIKKKVAEVTPEVSTLFYIHFF
jgi:hypothetical protein